MILASSGIRIVALQSVSGVVPKGVSKQEPSSIVAFAS